MLHACHFIPRPPPQLLSHAIFKHSFGHEAHLVVIKWKKLWTINISSLHHYGRKDIIHNTNYMLSHCFFFVLSVSFSYYFGSFKTTSLAHTFAHLYCVLQVLYPDVLCSSGLGLSGPNGTTYTPECPPSDGRVRAIYNPTPTNGV